MVRGLGVGRVDFARLRQKHGSIGLDGTKHHVTMHHLIHRAATAPSLASCEPQLVLATRLYRGSRALCPESTSPLFSITLRTPTAAILLLSRRDGHHTFD